MFFWTQSVETATLHAARTIRSGAVQVAGLSVQQFKDQKLCPSLAPGLSCDQVVVQVKRVAKAWDLTRTTGIYQFIDLTKPALKPMPMDQGSASFCPGASGDLIFVDVIYKAPVIFKWVWPSATSTDVNGEQRLLIRATSMIMNEPYVGAAGASC